MEVALLLPEPLRERIQTLLGHAHTLRPASSWESFRAILKRSPIEAAFVDPSMESVSYWAIPQLRKRFPSLPVLIYTRLAPGSLRVVADLSRHGVFQILLYRFDDSPEQLAAALHRLPGTGLRTQLAVRLSEPLERLPTPIREALVRACEYPYRHESIGEITSDLGMATSTFYRRCWEAGLRYPRRVLLGARVLSGYAFLRDPGYTVSDVAYKLGYRHPRSFAANVRAVFDMNPVRVRRAVSEAEALARVADWILRDESYTPTWDEDRRLSAAAGQ